jgi:glycerol-3-phosphate dehydrogenase (NAD(P)+)
MTVDEACKKVNQVVEGINSAKAAMDLAKKYDVSMPIVEEINAVLFENKSAADALKDLLTRAKQAEYAFVDWN